jgi:hypothetical protein
VIHTHYGIKFAATIIATPGAGNGYSYIAQKDGSNETFYLRGVGAVPPGTEVGDKGFLQYVATHNCGLYRWSKE